VHTGTSIACEIAYNKCTFNGPSLRAQAGGIVGYQNSSDAWGEGGIINCWLLGKVNSSLNKSRYLASCSW